MIDGEKNRLDSWKAIAEYLHRDVSTVMRWGRERKLPVHRVPGGKGHSVFGYREELEAWMAGQPDPQIAQTGPATVSGSFKWLWIGVAALMVCLILGGLIAVRTLRAAPVARVTFSGNRLLAWDERGRMAWTYEFPGEVRSAPTVGNHDLVRLVDLDGDGRNDVVAAVAFPQDGTWQTPREVLYCFSANGALVWRYEPNMTVNFGGRQWEGPWRFEELLVQPDTSRKSVWAAVAHHTWWPSFVLRVDPTGQASVQLTNPGVIYALNYVRTASGAYVLAGGVNNGYGAGILAVLDITAGPAVAPQPAGPYHCDSCSAGFPHRYFLFPPSELSRADQPYNDVRGIRLMGGGIQVTTTEVPRIGSNGFYELSENFDVETASLSDGYVMKHKQLEREGKLKHNVENCPELTTPKIVRRWQPQGGWTDVPVRWAAPPQ
jgi:hypothetical protein